MIRDTFFSLPRFMNLCRKEMVENWKTYTLRSVMIFGVLAVIFLLFLWKGYYQYEQIEKFSKGGLDPAWKLEARIFIGGLIIWGCISASFAMERMKSKTSRTVVLMTPATMFEKFFSRWLVATCGFIVVYLIAFRLADWTRVLVYMLRYPDLDSIAQFPIWQFCCNTGSFYEASVGSGKMLLFISGYLAAQSFFVLGSVIWPRNSLVKTFAAGICISIVYALILAVLTKAFLPDNFNIARPDVTVETMRTLVTIGFSLFALFNWVLAYFRFKESEIINRW